MTSFGQLLTIGISGTTLTTDEENFIVENDIGGVILFTRNISSPEQLWQLCNNIQELHKRQHSRTPLAISIDMEGGRVHRLKKPFTQWPALQKLGKIDSPQVAFNFAFQMGADLSDFGINMNYSPCLDVLTNPKNELIGDRSISADPEQVAKIGTAVIRGFLKSNVIPVGKHFPGHGETIVDSHFDLPIENLTLDRLDAVELVPFKKAFRAKLEVLMTAHMLFPNVDKQFPVTLSEIFLNDILRTQMRYRGFVMSDDLDMHALTKKFGVEEIPVRALEAGCDLLLYCNDPKTPPIGIAAIKSAIGSGRLSEEELIQKVQKWAKFKEEKLSGSIGQVSLKEALSRVALSQDFADGISQENLSKELIEKYTP